ncbi:AAA family ATPase [Halostagnicola kamekurae]|uniref:ORC1-type DNA replication protein n=1 Tax=Halostagnicola kamekurae TaxID=619731 RepID=A0A1I6P4L9_9EURY|nr:AAA family ATPase [Halostagnicola kamekurae]SFS35166.1 cell division control protein 6 [Halostagnicola kamekurae]
MSDDDLDMTDSDRNVELGGPDGFSTELKGSNLGDDEPNQGLFDDLLSGEPIFENKEVLRPSYTPHELPHRSDQINKMATILVAALRGETPSNILIYGKTGTGKTASAKFVSKELESTSSKYSVPCDVEYINCEVTDTQYRVLAQLANKFIEENEKRIETRLDELRSLVDSVEEFDRDHDTDAGDEQSSGDTSSPQHQTELDPTAGSNTTTEAEEETTSGSATNSHAADSTAVDDGASNAIDGDASNASDARGSIDSDTAPSGTREPTTDSPDRDDTVESADAATEQTSISAVDSTNSEKSPDPASATTSQEETSHQNSSPRAHASTEVDRTSGTTDPASSADPSSSAGDHGSADSNVDFTSGDSPVETEGFESSGDGSSTGSIEHPLEATPFDSLEDIEDRMEELEEDKESFEEVPMTGWPTDRVYSVFFDAVDYSERVVVIMLDEIDKLVEKSGDDTLYNLSRMNSELDNSRVSIIGISNDLKFTDFLDPRVKSSLGEEEIVFPPYDANQLRDILQHRSEVAFKGGALSGDVIPLCAAFAAQEHGDARRALDLLRTAGELAERSQSETIVEEHVRQAQDKIELDRVVEVVRTLPTQSKLVLFSIISLEKHGVQSINTGEVFNIYKRLCEEIDADVLTQRRVTDLISELDMLGIVNAVVVSKGRYGRTKEISLSVPLEETEAVLLSDSRLSDIDDIQPFVQARFEN